MSASSVASEVDDMMKMSLLLRRADGFAGIKLVLMGAQAIRAAQIWQIHQKRRRNNHGFGFVQQFHTRLGCASGGDQIIYQ